MEREPSAALALAGLGEAPDLPAVLAVTGSDRWPRLGLFLRKAGSADLAALMDRQKEDEVLTETELEMAWQHWVEVDIKAAMAWNGGETGVWAAWGRVDPKAALAAAGENALRLGQVIRSIGAKDQAWAERLLARYPQMDAATGLAGAVAQLSGENPAAAATLAMEKGAEWQKQVTAWSGRDPASALAWAREIPQSALKRQAMAEVIREWTRSDPAAGGQASTGTDGNPIDSSSRHRAGPGGCGSSPGGGGETANRQPPAFGHRGSGGGIGGERPPGRPGKLAESFLGGL